MANCIALLPASRIGCRPPRRVDEGYLQMLLEEIQKAFAVREDFNVLDRFDRIVPQHRIIVGIDGEANYQRTRETMLEQVAYQIAVSGFSVRDIVVFEDLTRFNPEFIFYINTFPNKTSTEPLEVDLELQKPPIPRSKNIKWTASRGTLTPVDIDISDLEREIANISK